MTANAPNRWHQTCQKCKRPLEAWEANICEGCADDEQHDGRKRFPFGKHKGEWMDDVPASYYDWLRDQPWLDKWPTVAKYMEDNAAAIDQELEQGGE